MALRPRTLSICSGVGGLDLGLRLACDARTVCYVEREARCAAKLVERMGAEGLDRAPIWGALESFASEPWRGRVDLVAGGIPWQPYADAGKRLAQEDERDLLDEFCRVVGEVVPRIVFVENVSGFVSLGIGRLLGRLADLGFDAEWDVFSAQGVGAPHRRRRCFVLAWRVPHADGIGLRIKPERGQGSAQETEQRYAEPLDVGKVMEAPFPPGGNYPGWRRLPPETQPGIRGVAYGFPARLDERDALRALGNAAVPLVVAHAFRTLAARAIGE